MEVRPLDVDAPAGTGLRATQSAYTGLSKNLRAKESVFTITKNAAVPRTNNRQMLPRDAAHCLITTKVCPRVQHGV
jgi:hypothetical protein